MADSCGGHDKDHEKGGRPSGRPLLLADCLLLSSLFALHILVQGGVQGGIRLLPHGHGFFALILLAVSAPSVCSHKITPKPGFPCPDSEGGIAHRGSFCFGGMAAGSRGEALQGLLPAAAAEPGHSAGLRGAFSDRSPTTTLQLLKNEVTNAAKRSNSGGIFRRA